MTHALLVKTAMEHQSFFAFLYPQFLSWPNSHLLYSTVHILLRPLYCVRTQGRQPLPYAQIVMCRIVQNKDSPRPEYRHTSGSNPVAYEWLTSCANNDCIYFCFYAKLSAKLASYQYHQHCIRAFNVRTPESKTPSMT